MHVLPYLYISKGLTHSPMAVGNESQSALQNPGESPLESAFKQRSRVIPWTNRPVRSLASQVLQPLVSWGQLLVLARVRGGII